MTNADIDLTGSRPRARPVLATAGIVLLLAVVNAVSVRPELEKTSRLAPQALMFALMGFEPVLFGVWTALGAGSILKRLPLAVVCLMFLATVPAHVVGIPAGLPIYGDDEYLMLYAIGGVIYSASVLLSLDVRRIAGFRIRFPALHPDGKLSFSIRELLILLTLVSLVMGMLALFDLENSERFAGYVLIQRTVMMFVLCILLLPPIIVPTTIVPLFILHGRPSRKFILLAAAIWTIATIAISVLFLGLQFSLEGVLSALLVVQLGSVALGTITGIWLRFSGLRLVRPPKSQPLDSNAAFALST